MLAPTRTHNVWRVPVDKKVRHDNVLLSAREYGGEMGLARDGFSVAVWAQRPLPQAAPSHLLPVSALGFGCDSHPCRCEKSSPPPAGSVGYESP